MRPWVVDALVRGHFVAWFLVAVLWTLVTAILLFPRREGRAPSTLRVLVQLTAGAAVSLAGLLLGDALSIPHVRWRIDADSPLSPPPSSFEAPASWRTLQGPAIRVTVDGQPDIALPALDGRGRWILLGLLSGRALDGLIAAPDLPPEDGQPRLCTVVDDASARPTCRAWPPSWPEPTPASELRDLRWSRSPLGAIAFDDGTARYLLPPRTPDLATLEFIGDPTASAAQNPHANTPLVQLRRISHEHFAAVRVVQLYPPASPPFQIQRAAAAFTAPTRLHALLPVLFLGVLALPLGGLAYLLAPVWFARHLRRRRALRRELDTPLTLDPLLPGGPADVALDHGIHLCAVRDDADLGDALLPRGALVPVAPGVADDEPFTARSWYELPAPRGSASTETPPYPDSAVRHEERGALRRVGLLVPADPPAFRRAARAWLSVRLSPVAMLLAGLSTAVPAAIAVASLLAQR
ncbi:hypothetical protein [Chondromyces crocatus]|uniref:Uncharacterized protein n=1 Tax=Chondromyces crocatus TaxID=52 RepID=A0A0K1EJ07_CHOCO|nr:hypothetical protein [Chondromyces crocatus]AKT40652.1 uncharacterized protein CMC5_048080 [Chondromyces crocatus]